MTDSKKRRFSGLFSFRVRTAILILIPISLGVLILTSFVNFDSAAQIESLDWLREKKGKFAYDFQIDRDGKRNNKTKPDYVPEFLIQRYGIDAFARVVEVDLRLQRIRDISPISNFKSLRKLNLESNRIKDISALRGMRSLEDLNISFNKIGNLKPIRNCTGLKKLNVRGNPVEDISFFKRFTRLEDLDVSNTNAFEYECLESMKLKTLKLNFSGLKEIPKVKSLLRLEIACTNVSDISPLEEMTDLRYLNLNLIPCNNFKPLENLTKLETLLLQRKDGPICDITPLKNLDELTYLKLPKSVVEMTPICNLKKLKYVEFPEKGITDLSLVKNLVHLECLRLLENRDVHGFEHLSNLKNLKSLWFDAPEFKDLSIFKKMKNLKELHIRRSSIEDLGPIANLQELVSLNIKTTEITKGDKAILSIKGLAELSLSSKNIKAWNLHEFKMLHNASDSQNNNRLTNRNGQIVGAGFSSDKKVDPLKWLPK